MMHRLHPLNQQLLSALQTVAFIAVLLKVKNRIIGAMVAERTRMHNLTEDDMNLLMTFGNQVALALDNAEVYSKIEQLNVGLEAKVRERTFELEQLNHELETTNEQLHEMNQVKSQFLSHCSHELRTPLTSIKGFTENLLQGFADPLTDQQQGSLTRVSANADRLTRMIGDLLDLSRIEAGKISLKWDQVNVEALAREVIEQFDPLVKDKNLHLVLLCSDRGLVVPADRDRLIQVLTNLIHNAMKFSAPHTTIRVQIEKRDSTSIQIAVSDEGRGIPEEAIAKLFEPFYQAHRQREIGTKGLGLGLAIVKTLVDLHGGTIEVESELGCGVE